MQQVVSALINGVPDITLSLGPLAQDTANLSLHLNIDPLKDSWDE